jgi:hypothetical protein
MLNAREKAEKAYGCWCGAATCTGGGSNTGELRKAYERGWTESLQEPRAITDAEVEAAMTEFVGEPPFEDYYGSKSEAILARKLMRAALEAAEKARVAALNEGKP